MTSEVSLTSRNKRNTLLNMLRSPRRTIRRLGLLAPECVDRFNLMDRQVGRRRLISRQRCLGSDLIPQRASITRELGEQIQVLLSIPLLEILWVLGVHVHHEDVWGGLCHNVSNHHQ